MSDSPFQTLSSGPHGPLYCSVRAGNSVEEKVRYRVGAATQCGLGTCPSSVRRAEGGPQAGRDGPGASKESWEVPDRTAVPSVRHMGAGGPLGSSGFAAECHTARFVYLSTLDIWGETILGRNNYNLGAVLHNAGYLAASLASTHYWSAAPTSICDNLQCLQTLPDAPQGQNCPERKPAAQSN